MEQSRERSVRETCCIQKFGKFMVFYSWKQKNGHIIFMSPADVPHMEKVFSIGRQFFGRSPTDHLNDLDECISIWCIFMNVTLQAAVSSSWSRLSRQSTNYQESTLEVCETVISNDWKLIKDQTEISGLTKIDFFWKKKTYVEIDDSNMWQRDWDYESQNLCFRRLGAVSGKYQWPTSRSLEQQN